MLGAGGGEGVCREGFERQATVEQAALAPGAHPVKLCNLHGKPCLHLGGDPLDTLSSLPPLQTPVDVPPSRGLGERPPNPTKH